MRRYTPHNQSIFFPSTWRHGWFVSDQRARYDAFRGHTTSLFCFFSASACLPSLGRAIIVSQLSRLLPSSLLSIASPPYCLLPSPICLTRLHCRDWKVYVSTSQLFEKPSASRSRFFPRARVCLGARHGRGPVIDVSWPSKW